MKRILLLVIAMVVGSPAFADQAQEPAVRRGVAHLRSQVSKMKTGEAALAAWAMSKARVAANDPDLLACLSKLAPNFSGTSYTPATRGGSEIFDAAASVLALASVDRRGYKPYIDSACEYILNNQMPNGAWDDPRRTEGDVVLTHYALMSLWEGVNSGVQVSPKVWDNAAKWHLAVQTSRGTWEGPRDKPSNPEPFGETGAGAVSLMLCRQQLARFRQGADLVNPLMTPLIIDGAPATGSPAEKLEATSAAIEAKLRLGLKWMSSHFRTSSGGQGMSVYEGLAIAERVTAFAGESRSLVPDGWYERGVPYVVANQKVTGAWGGVARDETSDTCSAILFLTKAANDTYLRVVINRLKAESKGMRGALPPSYPLDADHVEIDMGRVVLKPMAGSTDDMLDAIEDPRGEDAEKALQGLVKRYRVEGPKSLRPVKGRFLRLIHHKDEGLRKVAMWGLGRTGDLDTAPALIAALLDPSDDVAQEAKTSLQVLSRNFEGLGPAKGAAREERQTAALNWQQWFDSVKPPELDSADRLPIAPPKATAGAANP